MNTSGEDIIRSYGEAVLYGHLIEDVLRLHVYECGSYHVNGRKPQSWEQITDMSLKKLISVFGSMYPKAKELVDALDEAREIRNGIVHAFVRSFHEDLPSWEGSDQIHALLKKTILHQRRLLLVLQPLHESLLRNLMIHKPNEVLAHEDKTNELLIHDDENPPGKVSTSDVQKRLEKLDATPFPTSFSFDLKI